VVPERTRAPGAGVVVQNQKVLDRFRIPSSTVLLNSRRAGIEIPGGKVSEDLVERAQDDMNRRRLERFGEARDSPTADDILVQTCLLRPVLNLIRRASANAAPSRFRINMACASSSLMNSLQKDVAVADAVLKRNSPLPARFVPVLRVDGSMDARPSLPPPRPGRRGVSETNRSHLFSRCSDEQRALTDRIEEQIAFDLLALWV